MLVKDFVTNRRRHLLVTLHMGNSSANRKQREGWPHFIKDLNEIVASSDLIHITRHNSDFLSLLKYIIVQKP